MSLTEILTLIFAHLGALYMLAAAIGVVRLPDVLLRLHCISKAATLGVGCLLLAASLQEGTLSGWARSLAAITFFLITAPVSAHILGRAALTQRPQDVHHIDIGAAATGDVHAHERSSTVDAGDSASHDSTDESPRPR